MALNMIGGSGIGLPIPLASYNNVGTGATNLLTLAAGQAFLPPSGTYLYVSGEYTWLQYLDPVVGQWTNFVAPGARQPIWFSADGSNFRIVNLTGCPLGAVVTAAGTGYLSTNTTVVASSGNSTWLPIIGGAISTTVTISTNTTTNLNSGYTLPPVVTFPMPPAGGLPATGYATITSGAVSAITITSQGAGYTTAPVPTLIANQFETSNTISPPILTTTLVNSSGLTGLLCTNPGTPISTVPTLTISGSGSSAAAAVVMALTITAASTTTAGAGLSGAAAQIVGLEGSEPTVGNPLNNRWGGYLNGTLWQRPANIYGLVSGGALGTPVILDGGLYASVPVPIVLQDANTTAVSTSPVVSFTVGGASSTFALQVL